MPKILTGDSTHRAGHAKCVILQFHASLPQAAYISKCFFNPHFCCCFLPHPFAWLQVEPEACWDPGQQREVLSPTPPLVWAVYLKLIFLECRGGEEKELAGGETPWEFNKTRQDALNFLNLATPRPRDEIVALFTHQLCKGKRKLSSEKWRLWAQDEYV